MVQMNCVFIWIGAFNMLFRLIRFCRVFTAYIARIAFISRIIYAYSQYFHYMFKADEPASRDTEFKYFSICFVVEIHCIYNCINGEGICVKEDSSLLRSVIFFYSLAPIICLVILLYRIIIIILFCVFRTLTI